MEVPMSPAITNTLNTTNSKDYLVRIEQLQNQSEIIRNSDYDIGSSQAFEALEQKLHSIYREISDLTMAIKLQEEIDHESSKEEALRLAKSLGKRIINEGKRTVKIKLSGGTIISLAVTYYRTRHKNEKKQKGFYPALLLLGIYDRCSPRLASIVSQCVVALSSYEEAKTFLSVLGCHLNVKTISNIAKHLAQRARASLNNITFSSTEDVNGKRIVVSTDGGRIRIRKKKPGPKTKKNRNRYTTDWKEPKLLIIYAVDEDGKKDRCFMPFLDGTLQGADIIFSMIKYYLGKLQINIADKILFVADGALWIWNRIDELRISLGIKVSQFYEALDYYHATEHLGDFAKLIKGWSEKERKKWVKKQKGYLLDGHVDILINNLKELCKGKRNKELLTERDYFIRNQKRLDFKSLTDMKLPIGSGAMESGIRRIINLRFKGPGIFWKEESAEELIMLRSYYKAGRWNMLNKMAFSLDTCTDF